MPSIRSRDKVEEIKNQLDIVDVIGRDISLKHKGGGEYVGTVGTTGHTGESLKVNKNLQSWKDFKNGPGGDVLDWIGYHAGYSDTRGSDFPEVLRIAADLAGIELDEATEEEREAVKEKVDIHNLFTEAAEIYHKNLIERPELCDFILEKWGITRETVDKLKIGYATTGKDIKNLDKTILKKSGLVYVNRGMSGEEVFQGRIIFPYWKNGKVVYLIGRQTEETPKLKDGKEPPKYQKLLVHSDKFPYVSSVVQNSYFYGEDSIRGKGYCVITEGVTDCISLLQAEIRCVSPVTVRFREEDIPKLISLVKNKGVAYICNDNEANEVGIKGALATGEALEAEGIETRIIKLRKPEGIDKIDVADYLKTFSDPRDVFSCLMQEESVRLWKYKLNQQVIKDNSTSDERLRAFRTFIANDLRGMLSEEWTVFVNNEVPSKFRLTKRDVRTTVEEIGKIRKNENNKEEETQEERDVSDDRLSIYPEIIREQAYRILKEGDTLGFMLDTWNLRHVGDRNIGENCLCAVASTYITNTRGLHVKPSGESGKGKSDAIETVLNLLPEHKYISGSMSSKSLYYHPELIPGTIIYSDDANFTEDTIATLKQSTSNFQKACKHRTVVNQEYAEQVIPERCSFWFSTVDAIPDEQLANRFLNADVDGSREQDLKVYNHIKDSELDLNLPVDDDVLICRCIFDILDQELYNIKIPYINAIEWTNIENRRNFPKFLDILRSVTFFNIMQRQNINGYYLSDVEDFERALAIYKGTSKNNATNLSDLEIKVLKYIEKHGQVTIKQLMDYLKVSRQRVMQILHGKDGKGGMLAKVPQLNKIDRSKTIGGKDEDKTTTRENVYEYNGPKLGFEIYDAVAKIDLNEVEKEKIKFIEKLSVESATNATKCNHTATFEEVALKASTVERVISNATQKRKNIIEHKCDNIFSENIKSIENKEKNNFVSQTENVGCTVADEHKSSQPEVVIECNPVIEEKVALGYSGCTSESKENVFVVVDLLKKALRNFAKTEYHSIVDDLPEFVERFNEKTPTYVERLNYQRVYDEAEKLHKWGFR